jgi:MarR family transcriptional regulator, 2-MHQ and catechol-resistance regulon repressor
MLHKITLPAPSSGTLQDDMTAMQQITMRLSWASRRRLANELETYSLTVPQYMALRALQHNPQDCTMTRLAEASHQVTATMTGIVDRLAEHGLVERARDPHDRRALHVLLTSKGQSLMEEIDTHQRARLERVFAEFSPAERRQILDLLGKYLQATLSEIG